MLGSLIVGVIVVAWMVVSIIASDWPVWLVALLAVPLVGCVCAIVGVLVHKALTSPNTLLQDTYLRESAAAEYADEYVVELKAEVARCRESEQRRLTAGSEEETNVDA